MIQLDISFAVLTGLIIGLVKVATEAGLPTKFAPLLAIVLGVILTVCLAFFAGASNSVITGLVVALSAMGLYSGTKATLEK